MLDYTFSIDNYYRFKQYTLFNPSNTIIRFHKRHTTWRTITALLLNN